MGTFLVRDNRVLNGPLGRSLRPLARYVRSLALLTPLTRYAALRFNTLCFATLASLARSVQGLAHSLCSVPRGTVKILEYVFTLLSRFTGSNARFIFTRNTPEERSLFALVRLALMPRWHLLDAVSGAI